MQLPLRGEATSERSTTGLTRVKIAKPLLHFSLFSQMALTVSKWYTTYDCRVHLPDDEKTKTLFFGG